MNNIADFYSKKTLRAMCRAWALIAICLLANFTQSFAQQDSIQTGLRELGERSVSDYEEQNNSGIENKALNALNLSAAQLKAIVVAAGVTDFKVFDYTAYSLIGRMENPEFWNNWAFGAMDSIIRTGTKPQYGYQHFLLIAKEIDPSNGKVKYRVKLRLPTVENPGNRPTGGSDRSVVAIMTDAELKKIQESVLETSITHQSLMVAAENKESEAAAIKQCKIAVQLINHTELSSTNNDWGPPPPPNTGLGIAEGVNYKGFVITKEPIGKDGVEYVKVISNNSYSISGYSKYITTNADRVSVIRKEYYDFAVTSSIDKLKEAGLVLEEKVMPTYIYRINGTECTHDETIIDWDNSNTQNLPVLSTGKVWKSEYNHRKSLPSKCIITQTNYGYCNNATVTQQKADEIIAEFVISSGTTKTFKGTENELMNKIKEVCPDALMKLDYESFEVLFLKLATMPKIEDNYEIAILKLMAGLRKVSPNDPDKFGKDDEYRKFFAMLSKTVNIPTSNGSITTPLIKHLLKEMNDRAWGFVWLSNSRTGFVESLVLLYNDQPDVAAEMNPNILSSDPSISAKNTFHLGHNQTGTSELQQYFTDFKSSQTVDFFLGTYNGDKVYIKYHKNQIDQVYTQNRREGGSQYSTIQTDKEVEAVDINSFEPLTPVLVDTILTLKIINNAFSNASDDVNAVFAQITPAEKVHGFIVPAIFFAHLNDKYKEEQTAQKVFAGFDIITMLPLLKGPKAVVQLYRARKYWALAAIAAATTDLAINTNSIDADSNLGKVSNGLNAFIGLKNAPKAIKGFGSFLRDFPKATMNSFLSAKNFLSLPLADGKTFTQHFVRIINVCDKTHPVQVKFKNFLSFLLNTSKAEFIARLASYPDLLVEYNKLDDAFKAKFFEDFVGADHDVLQLLNDDKTFIEEWKIIDLSDKNSFANTIKNSFNLTRHPDWVEVLDIENKVLAKAGHVIDNIDINSSGTAFTGNHSEIGLKNYVDAHPPATYEFRDVNYDINSGVSNDFRVFEARPIIHQGGIEIGKANNGGISSYFPKAWDRPKILAEVEYAIKNNQGRYFAGSANEHYGFSRNGKIRIHFYIRPTDNGIGSYFTKKL